MPINSDKLRNENSFDYLQKIKIPAYMADDESGFPFAAKVAKIDEHSEYDESEPYGNLYTDFLQEIEAYIDDYRKKNNGEFPSKDGFDDLIDSVYLNRNAALEHTAEIIAPTVKKYNQTSGVEEAVTHTLKPDTPINRTTPTYEGSGQGRFLAMMAKNFKPMHTTSLPSVRKYKYQQLADHQLPVEIRFGTQAQRDGGEARVSPLFAAWCHAQKSKVPDGDIAHLYINNLGKDRGWSATGEGEKERNLTLKLEQFGEANPHIAVITLPADKGMLSSSKLTSTTNISMEHIKSSILSIACKNGKDFYISDHIKNKLYKRSLFKDKDNGDESVEHKKLSELLENSIKALGFERRVQLSEREQQALYFHFLKFELTNYIIDTLQPKSFNMSCKDAIDRGGVSSAYYNLIKSIKNGTPLSQEEFERALHAPPALVKGRGMNHHAKIIWNAIDCYLKGTNDKTPDWLTEWRNQNRPSCLVAAYKQSMADVIQKTKTQVGLVALHDSISAGKHDSSNHHRDLWRRRRRSSITRKYSGSDYGETKAASNSLKDIEDKLRTLVREEGRNYSVSPSDLNRIIPKWRTNNDYQCSSLFKSQYIELDTIKSSSSLEMD
ncbi:hypothetical protein [Piscirickettsia litoralis]|uniref:Uncharacterized protein n=1 Tax=Piscirickettsia litoralis TaxID=1891921 RepID=A0ABX2ZZD4_9GAMM|nr:hypothetical protein [Piscirickettsia litoralis]ODN41754.1 hypothetical protein BGC07_00590 [Piscirickettsia litoralis]